MKNWWTKIQGRTDYSEGLIACYQQLERYKDAEEFLLEKIKQGNTYPILLIELGYNHALQNAPEKASEYYGQALTRIDDNPNLGYSIALRFQKYSLLDLCLKSILKGNGIKSKIGLQLPNGPYLR